MPTRVEEKETPVILNMEVIVYNERKQEVGYFIGLEWKEGFPEPSTKRARAPSAVATGGESSTRHSEFRKHGETKRSRNR